MKRTLILICSIFLLTMLSNACSEAGKGENKNQNPKGDTTVVPKANDNSGGNGAVDEQTGEEVRQVLEHLFEICEGGDFSQAAEYLIYSGDDKTRRWKSMLNYDNAEEKAEVDKTCAKIQVILNNHKAINYKQFVTEKESEGTWLVWIVDVIYEDGTQDEKAFAFLKVEAAYGLGDID